VPATPRALELAKVAATAAEEKIAHLVVAIDVSEQLALTDVFVIASASNERQVGAVVDEVEDRLREQGCKPLRREGERDGRWVLIDFGDIVVHVQRDEERDFYQLERLWRDCPEVDLAALETLPRPVAVDKAVNGTADGGTAVGGTDDDEHDGGLEDDGEEEDDEDNRDEEDDEHEGGALVAAE